MIQEEKTIRFEDFAAVPRDSGEVLGKVLYYSLSSILKMCIRDSIIKGRIVKERHTVTEENRGPNNRLMSTEIRETISNRMIFNILTPSGFRSLT